MLLFIGIILLLVSIIMTIRAIVHRLRPKADAKIHEVFFQHVRTDKKLQGRPHRHARVSFLAGTNKCEAVILLWMKAEQGENVVVTYKPSDPTRADLYAPRKGNLIDRFHVPGFNSNDPVCVLHEGTFIKHKRAEALLLIEDYLKPD